MKTNSCIILLGLLLTSCLDDFEPNISSFNKVYGNNLDANLAGILATKDDGFLLYGSMDKSIQSAPGSTGDLATIIKTDAMGNEMWMKSFGISNISFENNPFLAGSTWEVSEIYFESIVQLQNGNYFATFTMVLPELLDYNAPCYVVFSSTGAILEYNTFMDNIADPGYLANELVVRYSPTAFNIPESSDIIIVFNRSSLWLAPNFVENSNRFYSLYRLRENMYKNPVWIMDNKVNLPDGQLVNALTFDNDGTIVLVGRETANDEGQCFRTFVSKVDAESGVVIDEKVLTPQGELHMPASIIPYNNGYAVQELRNPPDQACRWLAKNDPKARNIGGIRLVSNDLVSDTLVYSTPAEMAYWTTLLFLESFDNGLVFGFGLSGESQAGSYISKVDVTGQMIWEYRDHLSEISSGLFQTADGGIVFGATSSSGGSKKWSLTKLTRDGEL